MANIEHLKKSRKVIRGSFTKQANEFQNLFSSDSVDNDALEVTFELLKTKYEELKVLNTQIYDILLESASEADLESEIDSCDLYEKKYTEVRIKFNKLQGDSASVVILSAVHTVPEKKQVGMRKFKLPRIEFKSYDGNIKDWLAFWSQFKKVHDDNSIDNSDKIEYLIQATVAGSRARRLVESYPAMGENYIKIIESMESRFGREDLQIEVYIRELLRLILSNSASKQKFDIATLYDQIETQLRALETLGVSSDKCSAMLFPLIESCLPHDLIRVWQRSPFFNDSSTSEDDTVISPLEVRLKNLLLFLRQEVENEQRINLATEGFGFGLVESTPPVKGNRESHATKNIKSKQNVEIATATGLMNCDVATCVFCGGSHDSSTCFKAQKMTYDQKREILAQNKACYRCLKIGHHSKRCRGRLRCVLCKRSHVVLMCPDIPPDTHPTNIKDNTLTRVVQKDQVLANQTSTRVFLQTLQVRLIGTAGSKTVRALIDSGSQRSYVLKSTAQQLEYKPKRSERVVHCLFGGREVLKTHNCYDITISTPDYKFTFEALDEITICGDVAPVFQGQCTEEMRSCNAEISDIGNLGPIEFLLGADVAGNLYTGGRRELQCGLFAIETPLGWTLMGKVPTVEARSDTVMTTLNLFVNDASISDLWELETIGIKDPSDKCSKEEMEREARELFLQTVRVDSDGRYEVRLPWLDGHPPPPTNYGMAQKRLGTTLNKLKSKNLFEQYYQIFVEWEREGIIEVVEPAKQLNKNQGHYLPHRPVIKDSSSTTKIRPVFDASAHETAKPALNHCLETGPNLIELIPSMLLRFRENRMGVTADIRKAFLQIGIHENDRDYLRFLWVNGEGQEIVLRHKRVVFGVNSSPFLLGATLEHHLAQCLEKCNKCDVKYSRETIEKLSKSFYVDNCVASLPDEQSLSQFIREAMEVISQGQFELRQWEHTRTADCNTSGDLCPLLGLVWDPRRDVLSVNPEFIASDLDPEKMMVTKRQILAITQKVFDPIGYTCPAVLIPKLMLQRFWKEQLTWDQTVDDVVARSFKDWIKDLPYLIKIEVPRWLGVTPVQQNLNLHTFCDVSGDSYACAIFLRAVTEGKVSVFLLAAKARVAPLKKSNVKMTIPRLELLAATIGARLYSHVKDNLEKNIDSFFWSDSSTVLSWIKRKEEWGVFVWNRVAEIRNLTNPEKWNHLPGIYNPADLPSRGCSPKQLFESRWWEGPKWLYDDPQRWPCVTTTYNEDEIDQERKKKLITTLVNVENVVDWHLDYFGKYSKTLRMIAWIFRFIHNARYCKQRCVGILTSEEIEAAEKFVCKLVQQKVFSSEKDKIISCLNPFRDTDGLIRLKTRISNRTDTEGFRFPIVLPSGDSLVKSLIMDMHVRSCHVGTQGLLSLLRENFWILGGRRTIRSVISNCVVCKRFDAKPLAIEPPPLPLDRVRDASAFEVTGIDFAGPLYLKNGDKAWVCLFTCAVYRAVHLELTTSMSTQSFLQALRRFVSRRGRPKTIYSDNGTNFVGTENAFSQLNWDNIVHETSIQRICWRFNPPTAAWWGGFWERLIGVLKTLLKKVLGRASLKYEDLLTVLCDCESVINERPITYLSGDSKDLIALTPSMFLRDQTECGLPDCDVIDRESLCKRVRKIQTLRENVQKRFRTEYLGQLKSVYSKQSYRKISVGEIVLVGNDNSKRLNWPIFKVVEVLPSKDGQVRLVRVETPRGTLLRPVQRLYPLECDDNSASQMEDDQIGGNEVTGVTTCPEDPETATEEEASVSAGVAKMKITRSGRVSKMPQRFL